MTTERTKIIQPKWVCKYCHRPFVLEARYLAHKCQQMKRAEEIQTPDGQAGWHYYQLWMRAQKRMAPPASSFLASKYYRTFINFAKHVKSVGLPKPERFIWLMKEKELQPTIWTNDEVYSMYIEFLDRQSTPLEQAKLSIETLLNIADKRSVDVCDVFDVLTPNEVLQLIRRRQLSPWLLLFSKKFKILFKQKATDEQRLILETMIRGDYWAEKLADHPKEQHTIKQLVTELNV